VSWPKPWKLLWQLSCLQRREKHISDVAFQIARTVDTKHVWAHQTPSRISLRILVTLENLSRPVSAVTPLKVSVLGDHISQKIDLQRAKPERKNKRSSRTKLFILSVSSSTTQQRQLFTAMQHISRWKAHGSRSCWKELKSSQGDKDTKVYIILEQPIFEHDSNQSGQPS
jgi:hypothetical protein